MKDKNLKIVIVSGSHRKSSQSLKVSKFLRHQLEEMDVTTTLFDLGKENQLPVWDENWKSDALTLNNWEIMEQQLTLADGFIFVTPEYNGMASPALKNFFMFTSKKSLGHKPALLVSVSAGANGSYPIAELRMSSYKNNRVCFLPEHLIVRKAESLLNPVNTGTQEDEYIRKRIDYALRILCIYTVHFREVRKDYVNMGAEYPNGM